MKLDSLDRVTRTLQRAIASSDHVGAPSADRSDAIARIEDALRRRRTMQRRRRFVLLAAAAAVLLVAGFAARRSEPIPAPAYARVAGAGAVVVHDGHEAPLAPGERVVDGAELRTPASGEANLDFERGSRLAVQPSSRVRLERQGPSKRFALEEGRVRAKVAKLAPDERFVVATADSEIEVRGTEFDVALVTSDPACGDGTPTRVDVREGVVVVRHAGVEHRIEAGDHWPRCAPPPAPAPSTSIAAARPSAPAPRSSAPPPSRLAEQNDLFQDALRRKRNGDTAGALETLDRLRTDYGDGPLAESAEVERFRILSGVDRDRAATAARDYLRARPNGFARAEAEALANPGP